MVSEVPGVVAAEVETRGGVRIRHVAERGGRGRRIAANGVGGRRAPPRLPLAAEKGGSSVEGVRRD